jgi:hypothetical protein
MAIFKVNKKYNIKDENKMIKEGSLPGLLELTMFIFTYLYWQVRCSITT